MNKTSKLVVGVAVVAAAYAGAAWYMGTKAEPNIKQQVAEFNDTLGTHYGITLNEDMVRLKIVNYNRSWFSSTINYELMIDDGQEQYQLLFEDHLHHGPLPFAALLKGRIAPLLAYSELKLLPSQNVQPWFDATKDATPITAQSFIEFNGSSDTHITIAAVGYENELGDQVKTDVATVYVDYKKDKDQVYVDAELPTFLLIDGEDGTQIQLKDTHFTGRVISTSQGQNSDGTLRIEQVGVNLAESVDIWVDGLTAKSAYTLSNNLLDSSFYYDLARVRVDEHDLGRAELDIEAKRLDSNVLVLLSQSDLIDELSEAELEPLLKRFFSHKPELKINPLSWKNAAGESHVIADIKMASTAADDYTQNEMDPAHFFEVLDVDISLSREMLKGFFTEDTFTSNLADMLFTRFAQQGEEAGLLVYDGNNAQLKLQFDAAADALILNGRPAQADELFYSWLLLQMGGGLGLH